MSLLEADQACVADLYPTLSIAEANNDMFWMLFGSFMVFFMQAGFAMLEAGQVRIKNRTNMLLKNIMDATLGGIMWYLVGYAFAFGKSAGGFIGSSWDYLSGCGNYASWMFQWTFAATAATIVSGAVAERCKFTAYMVLTILMQGWVYPVIAHWVWSGSGWLRADFIGANGLLDFAGSGVVHMTGGTAALFGAYIIGPRTGRFSPDSSWIFKGNSIALTTLGAFCLWFGWYGFNCASTGSYQDMYMASRVAICTTLGACGGGAVALVLHILHTGVPEMMTSLNGILSGLVSVTAGCAYMEPYIALITGSIGGCLGFYSAWFIERMKIDDPVDASAVHLGCGLWGLLSVGLFAAPHYLEKSEYAGLVYGGNPHQLGIQVLGAVSIFSWTAGWTGSAFWLLRRAGWLRVGYEDEIAGLDKMMADGEEAVIASQQFQPSAMHYQLNSGNRAATPPAL